MKKNFAIYDPQTFAILRCEVMEEAEAPQNSTAKLPDGEVYPVYDPVNDLILEGATPEELSLAKAPDLMLRLQALSSTLRIKAIGAAIDKTGSPEYIQSQRELYEIKYKVAKGLIVDPYIEGIIANEAIEFNASGAVNFPVDTIVFKQIIIQKYEEAEATYHTFIVMIERCRTKIQTLIEALNFTAAEQGISLAESMENKSQAEEVLSAILAL